METIGILAAMPQERDAQLKFVGERSVIKIGGYRCQRFRLGQRECFLLTSGMGIQRAARAARALVEVLHPALLASVGIAGAVQPDLGIGDVVVSKNTCLLELGQPGPLQPLAQLSAPAWDAALKALAPRRAGLFWGTAITTRGSQPEQPEQMENPVLEMETAGFVQVSAPAGVPLLSVRAISDGPQSPIPFDLEAAMDENYNLRMGVILKALLARPRIFLQLMQMGRNSTLAAENAAIALLAALNQPEPVI